MDVDEIISPGPSLRQIFSPDPPPQKTPPVRAPEQRPKKPPNKQFKKKQAPWAKPVHKDGPASKEPKIGSRTSESTVKIRPIKTWYPVFATNAGLEELCNRVFHFMKSQSPKLQILVEQLKYVTCVAYWNRVVQLNIRLGKLDVIPPDSYELNNLAVGIKLPALIAQYISSFGIVELPSGTNIIPRYPGIDAQEYVYPLGFWIEGHPAAHPPAGPWTLDSSWITDWNENCSKGGRVDFGLRTVDYMDTTGSNTMCVSYLDYGDTVRPIAPYNLTFPEADLGAAFAYRDYSQYNTWPGLYAELLFGTFEAPPVYRNDIISKVCGQLSKDLWASKHH